MARYYFDIMDEEGVFLDTRNVESTRASTVGKNKIIIVIFKTFNRDTSGASDHTDTNALNCLAVEVNVPNESLQEAVGQMSELRLNAEDRLADGAELQSASGSLGEKRSEQHVITL